jgi:hypothetical protein
LQLEVLALVCSVVTDVRTICVALCTSSSARQAILAKCSGNLHLQLKAEPYMAVFGRAGDATATVQNEFAGLQRVIQQSAWLAQYGGLVGQLDLEFHQFVGAAAKPAFEAVLRPPVQLSALRLLNIQKPAPLLKALDPSRLTAVHVVDAAGAVNAQSALACAALGRLTGLQQLSWTRGFYPAHDSLGAALAGMPQLTQLVLHPQLSAAALAQLPSQLVELQLSSPQCEGAELVAYVQALRQLQSLTLVHKPEDDDERTVDHGAAWAALKALKRLDIVLDYYRVDGSLCVMTSRLAASIASAKSLTELRLLCSGGGSADVDVVAMLAPLKQLESLQLCLDYLPEHGSFGNLFSKHITRLRRLTLGLGRLRQVAVAQLCFQATQLTQLVLDSDAVDDAGLEVIGHSMMPLRQLAICNCSSVTADGIGAALGMPSLRLLQQLTYVDERHSARVAAARLDVQTQRRLVFQVACHRAQIMQGVVGSILPLGS